MACLAPSSVVALGVGGQGLRLAQGDEGQGDDDRQGQEDVETDPGQIDPEVAEPLAPVGRERARDGAAAMAMPAAADRKLWLVRPAIWEKADIVVSGT